MRGRCGRRVADRRVLRGIARRAGFGDGNESIASQVFAQAVGVVATIVYTFIVSFVVLKILDAAMGLRVTEDQEEEGLDLALHDERGYIL